MTIDFEALIAHSPNPYVVMDTDLRLIWMNEAYLRVTMRARDELVGRRMFEAFPSDDGSDSHRLLEGSLRRVLATGQADEIALIRYDIHRPDGSMEERYWSATHTPFRDGSGQVAHILQHTVDVTELHGLRTMRDQMGLLQRASAVQARNLDLSEETARLKMLFEQAPGFIAVLRGPDHVFQVANEAYRRLVGQRDLIGRPLAEALPEVVAQGFVGLLDNVRATGTPFVGRDYRVVLENDRDGAAATTYLDFVYQPIFAADGTVSGIFVQGHDVTEQVQAAERQRLMMSELNHRVKNTLAIVQGLAMQSFRQIEGSGAAQATFEARLGALAAAHGLLTAGDWKAAGLIETLRGAVEATAGSAIARFRFEGPDFTLDPQAAVSVAMIVHELSTNAIKYGALSVPGGEIALRWTISEHDEADCLLAIDWIESGGPPVREPSRTGFGTRLIRRGFSSEQGSGVAMHFRPEGLHCTITARLPRPAD